MTLKQVEKYKKWMDHVANVVLALCISGTVTLFVHDVEGQSIHKTQSKDIDRLKVYAEKTIIIPESIKLNAYKINQCNKSIDEMKRDLKTYQVSQDAKMTQVISLLIEIKSKR